MTEILSASERERRERARLRTLLLSILPTCDDAPAPEHGWTAVRVARALNLTRAGAVGIITGCVRGGLVRRDLVETPLGLAPRYRLPAPPRPTVTPSPAERPPAADRDPVALYRYERARRAERLHSASAEVIAQCRELLREETERARENKGARRGRPKGVKNRATVERLRVDDLLV